MQMPLVSVIVPVYKTEKYLDRCVESIVNQTYRNLEIILVDDGSPDKCPQICDEWAKKDERIKVVHKQNGGQSFARNVGILNATGDYIGFVDSDDWVSKDMYGYLLNLLLKYKAEIAQVVYENVRNEQANFAQKEERILEYIDEEIMINYAATTTVVGDYSVCDCLFSADIVKSLKFREGKVNEDIDYKFKAFLKCHKFIESNQVKYFYWQDSSSTTRDGLKKRDFDLYDAANALYELSKDSHISEVRKMGIVKKARTPFSLLCKIAYYGIADISLKKDVVVPKLLSEHRHNVWVLLCSKIPPSRKILAIMFFVNFELTEFCIRLVKRFL